MSKNNKGVAEAEKDNGYEKMEKEEVSEFDENMDESWGNFESECRACDLFGQVNDLLLCQECAAKLERDLIRQRDWAYSATAYGLSSEEREELHRRVVKRFGQALELIVPSKKSSKDKMQSKKRRRR